MGEIVSLQALAAKVRSGMRVAVPVDHCGVAMAATSAIIANRPKTCIWSACRSPACRAIC